MIAPVNGTESPLLKHTPENSPEYERAAIASLLEDDGKALDFVAGSYVDDVFYNPLYLRLYQAAKELHRRAEPVNVTTLTVFLKSQDRTEEVSALPNIAGCVPSSANALFYFAKLEELHRGRLLVLETAKALEVAKDKSLPIGERADLAQRLVFDVAQKGHRDEEGDTVALLGATFAQMERRKAGRSLGPAFGFDGIDDLTGGMNPGDVCAIGARPAMGKTSLATNIMRNAADDRRLDRPSYSVAFYSLEMPATAIMLNLLCSVARVDTFNARTGRLSEDEHRKLLLAAEAVERWRIHIESPAFLDTLQLRSRARRRKAEAGLDLVIIDYLQLMRSTSRWRSRQEEVSEISRDLKGLASELHVPVIALAQLNRNVEDRTDHRPRLSDLRESGAIEADAAVVMLLHRDDYYMKREQAEAEGKTNRAQVILAKNRHGPIGEVELFYEPAFGIFANANRGGERAP